MQTDEQIEAARKVIQQAEALLITAGAGMGVDSGLPDFRGPQGFWCAYPAIARLGLSFEEIANPNWFRQDPALAWAFYGHRLNLYRITTPHGGFGQLLQLGQSKRHGYFVFTSNVDGHFQRAGFDPERIVECHGSIHHFQCVDPCGNEIWDASAETVKLDEENFRANDPLPKCTLCSALARPNVLMFGDWNWISHRTDAQHRRFEAWLSEVDRAEAYLAVIEVGAGTALPTIRHTSERVVRSVSGKLIRINPRQFGVPPRQIGIPLGAAESIRRLCG
ncbi:MAG TPA: Sir2 family NAD-dependent protein deacetylase [Candidatus Limnocylindrales bacterium]|jgi:NAD-dependent SIR2 family protein deacetylase|nr:Sir2 family NAD-dependent protein deacetylase [Candidatus Limnocylindrales bacterium]